MTLRLSAMLCLVIISAYGQQPAPLSPTSQAIPPEILADNPDLKIAVMPLRTFRATELIGVSVYNEKKEKIGTINDLIITYDNQILTGIISVGNFLGVGNKLVAIPFDKLSIDLSNTVGEMVELSGASREKLLVMKSFSFNK